MKNTNSIEDMIKKEADAYAEKEWSESGVTDESELTFKGTSLKQLSSQDYTAGRLKGIEREKELEKFVNEVATGQRGELKSEFINRIMRTAKLLIQNK